MAIRNNHVCFAVPPYLLSAIADSDQNEAPLRESARNALNFHSSYCTKRVNRFAALTQPRGLRGASGPHARPNIVPDSMLRHISESEDVDEDTRACAKRDLEHLRSVQSKYQQQQGLQIGDQQKTLTADDASGQSGKNYRAVYDAEGTQNEQQLPGKVIRVEGQAAVKDESVNEAYDNAGKVLSFYKDIFNWNSIDNKNMHVVSSVHFGKNYENAFWDPELAQMVYGDGHTFLTNFTGAVDVIGHELTHAVTEYTSPLDYTGQSGALNEHVSDVFGIMIKQRVQDETADKADWLIGEDCLMPGVKGTALRSMKAPGTAYNDPRFGKDPQPDNFADYKVTEDDNGGVHMYSGIPNKAFYLASVAFGGYSWEKAGKVWWETMQSGQVPSKCTFIQFADVTVDQAEKLFGDEGAATVRKAWNDVGVTRKQHT
ncbi:Metalloprotease [Xylariaceae sp. FL0016]|nr:Metalloprotease [Xylariaceae sp. FL0016]